MAFERRPVAGLQQVQQLRQVVSGVQQLQGVRQPQPGGSSPKVAAAANASNPAFNKIILNALSNRGLLSQQNGKFVYVGDKATAASTTRTTASGKNFMQLAVFLVCIV